MKLYADPVSTTSRPILFMVAHAGLDVSLVPVSLREGGCRTPEFLALNPMGKVPVLVDDDFVLTESVAILRYLAVRSAPDLYPDEPRQRARVDEAISLAASDLYTALAVMTVYPRMNRAGLLSAPTVSEMAASADPQIRRVLDVLDRRLEATGYAAGPAMTIADFIVLAYLTVGDLVDLDISPWPRVSAWVEVMKALPAWSDVYAPFNAMVQARRMQS